MTSYSPHPRNCVRCLTYPQPRLPYLVVQPRRNPLTYPLHFTGCSDCSSLYIMAFRMPLQRRPHPLTMTRGRSRTFSTTFSSQRKALSSMISVVFAGSGNGINWPCQPPPLLQLKKTKILSLSPKPHANQNRRIGNEVQWASS